MTARTKGKDRGVDLAGIRWIDDPITLARDPGIDVFVELMGGDGDPAKAAVEAALSSKSRLSLPTRRCSRVTVLRWRSLPKRTMSR